MMDIIPIGKIVSTHGLRGEVKFRYYNEVQEDFLSYTSFFTTAGGIPEIRPQRVRWQKGFFYIVFEGIETIDDAGPLIGKELFVKTGSLPPVEEGTYYDFQLMGLAVVSHRGEAAGTVTEIVHQPGSDILVVDHNGEEIFVPMTDRFIRSIDREQSRIVLTEDVVIS